jgi:hypothetical protein
MRHLLHAFQLRASIRVLKAVLSLVASLVLLTGTVFSQTQTSPEVTICGFEVTTTMTPNSPAGKTTFTWTVQKVNGRTQDLSHFAVSLCADASHFSGGEVTTQGDCTVQPRGLKFNANINNTGPVIFTAVFNGTNLGLGLVNAVMKTGGNCCAGQMYGPVCCPTPTADAGTDPAAQCYDASDGINTFAINGDGTNGTPSWAVFSKPASWTVQINNGNTFDPTVDVTGTAAGGTVTLRLTVTAAGSCGTATDDVDLVISAKPATPNTEYLPPSCEEDQFKVKVLSPVIANATYTLKTLAGTVITTHVPANTNEFTFATGIDVGLGYRVSVTLSNTCVSDDNVCGESSLQAAPVSNNETIDVEIRLASTTRVLATPNPFTNRVRFDLESAVSGQGSLEVFNVMGQRVAVVYNGYITAGQRLIREYSASNAGKGTLFYVFKVGDQKVSGKLIKN